MADDYPLLSLGLQIKAHWKEHRPKMYRELEQAGRLDQAVYEAQERTRDAFGELVEQGVPAFQADEATRELWAFLPEEEESDEAPDEGHQASECRVMDDAPVQLSPEEADCLLQVVQALQPMGGYTLDDEDGQPGICVCGAPNVPPYVPSIRRALQEASEAGVDPEALYRRAVSMYERLDADRRREHPEWTWPAPPFEAVEPVTWPPLEPEVQRSVHVARLSSALRARDDEPRRVERLRGILERAQARGLDPEALYREATTRYVTGSPELARRPAPPYEEVSLDRDSPQS